MKSPAPGASSKLYYQSWHEILIDVSTLYVKERYADISIIETNGNALKWKKINWFVLSPKSEAQCFCFHGEVFCISFEIFQIFVYSFALSERGYEHVYIKNGRRNYKKRQDYLKVCLLVDWSIFAAKSDILWLRIGERSVSYLPIQADCTKLLNSHFYTRNHLASFLFLFYRRCPILGKSAISPIAIV